MPSIQKLMIPHFLPLHYHIQTCPS